MNPRTPLLLAGFAVALLGCDQDLGDDPLAPFIAALPTTDTLAIEIPGEDEVDTATAPLSIIEAPLIGSPSVLKSLTGTVRRYLGKLVANAIEDIERMSDFEPVLQTPERVVWNIVTPALQRQRTLVMRREQGHITLVMWVRDLGPDARPSGPWKFLLGGRFAPSGARAGEGRGAMWIDLDNDRRPRSRGKAAVLWSNLEGVRDIEVMVFDGTPDDDEVARLTRTYAYHEDDEGGRLAFDVGDLDVHLAPERPGLERVRVQTRWNAARAVRADYSATGPEVRQDGYRVLIGSECWRAPEAKVTYETRVGLPRNGAEPVRLFERGDRGSCAFPEEEPPIVAAPGAAPVAPPRPEELDEP